MFMTRSKQEQARHDDYHDLFVKSEQGPRVLQDLSDFCRYEEWNHPDDPIKFAKMMGRREMYNWILCTFSDDYMNNLKEHNKEITAMEDGYER